MKSILQSTCRWLAVYLLSLAGTVYLAENLQGLRLLADPIPTATEPGGGEGGGEEEGKKCPD